ncbi:hypothetical protein HI914_00929 [Erysiphe necator]|nr:hypothetical protein HI914_00929 [Erysiphe necator]
MSFSLNQYQTIHISEMRFLLLLTLVATGLLFSVSLTNSSKSPNPSLEIRDFVHMTNLMQKMGIRVAVAHPHDKAESNFGFVIGIEPALLILLPQGLMLNSKNEHYGSDRNHLMVLTTKIENLRLICHNSRVQKYFPSWSIVEVCSAEVGDIFSAQLKNLYQANARLAIAIGDFEDTPIMEIGKLTCFPLPGKCQSPRPTTDELVSILALQNRYSEVATVQTPSDSSEYLGLAKSTNIPSEISDDDNTPHNSLLGPPLYMEDPNRFDRYISKTKEMAVMSTCITSDEYFWKNLQTIPDCLQTSTVGEVGT